MVSGTLSLIACHLLIDTGLATNIYSYPLVVEKVLGRKFRITVETFIALTQYTFAISFTAFIIKSFKSTIDKLWDVDSEISTYIVVICLVLSLLSWTRNLARLSFTF